MSIMEYVLRSLTRACAGTSAQVVIHKVSVLPSDSFVECLGFCLSEDCDLYVEACDRHRFGSDLNKLAIETGIFTV
jgi:hypothetical protein